ncbi:MAG: ATPase, T2SS/T4P/T4SS family [Candidatus Jordarchaeales archaeon]
MTFWKNSGFIENFGGIKGIIDEFNGKEDNTTVVDEYEVGPYRVRILCLEGGEFKYVAEDVLLESFGRRIIDQVARDVSAVPFKVGVHKLDDIIFSVKEAAIKVISRYFKLSYDEVERMAESATFNCIGLASIAPFLLDDKVEEVYFDGRNRSAYLDHRDWGRCITDVVLSDEEVERILSRIRLESGFQLDDANPSLKTEVITRKFRVRVLATTTPLAAEGFMINFRRMRDEPYTIPELIFNGTISAKAAAYLLFLILRRFNICVVGEPKTGKTTLINALDILVPLSWRRIYIEDAVESLALHNYGAHQAKVKVKPPEEGGEREKAKEITQLLHRSPDWVYLGEIRSVEDSQAMFHALTSGLVGLQTCHGKSVEDVILRWVIHHKIPPASLKSLDVIVEVKRYLTLYGGVKRRVVRITEACDDPDLFFDLETIFSKNAFISTFVWDPKLETLQLTTCLTETPSFKKTCEIYGLDENEVLNEIETYEEILRRMSEKRLFNVRDNIIVINRLYKLLENKKRECNKWTKIKEEVVKFIEERAG